MGGFGNDSFGDDLVIADNVDFTGQHPQTKQITGDGELLIGNALAPNIRAGTIISASLNVGYSSPDITIETAGGGAPIETLTPDEDADGSAATPIAPQSGNINILGSNPSGATVTESYNSTGASTGNMTVEHRAWTTKLVVDTSTTPGTRGTFSTLASALAAATAGETVFLRTSVTENVTLPANVNIAGWSGSSASTPSITGQISVSSAGTSTISGIRLVTNSAAFLAVTGSAASIVNLENCYLDCADATGITNASSDAGASIVAKNCRGNIGTTGIALFSDTSAGNLAFINCNIGNSGGSTTASTKSAGQLNIRWSSISNSITTSGTNSALIKGIRMASLGNTTALTIGGSGTNEVTFADLVTGTAAAVNVSSALQIVQSNIFSSNANPLTGSGSISYSDITFSDSGSGINVSTIAIDITKPRSEVVTQVFTSNGTYTPTFGMVKCIVEIIGGGGGSGGCQTTIGGQSAFAAGGGGGEYARGLFTAATIGASQVVTIGSGGTGATAGANTGGTGNTSSLGALITAIGGAGGTGGLATDLNQFSSGGTGGTGGTGGDFRSQGSGGGNSLVWDGANFYGTAGFGGGSFFGGNTVARLTNGGAVVGQNYGGGGGGGVNTGTRADRAGGAGAPGVIVITEYLYV